MTDYKEIMQQAMEQYKGIMVIGLSLMLGVLLQVVLIAAELSQDSPREAAVQFTKAYYWVSPAMKKRLCEENQVKDGRDVVDNYIFMRTEQARERGFGLFFLREMITHVTTDVDPKDGDTRTVTIKFVPKPPLKDLFMKELYRDDYYGKEGRERTAKLKVKNVDGCWKVCGDFDSLFDA